MSVGTAVAVLTAPAFRVLVEVAVGVAAGEMVVEIEDVAESLPLLVSRGVAVLIAPFRVVDDVGVAVKAGVMVSDIVCDVEALLDAVGAGVMVSEEDNDLE